MKSSDKGVMSAIGMKEPDKVELDKALVCVNNN
jgi:hypothetical protein